MKNIQSRDCLGQGEVLTGLRANHNEEVMRKIACVAGAYSLTPRCVWRRQPVSR
ncbi:protein of unknown function [Burkholderia multivorans]